jgi:hypothetical protein
MAATIQTVVGVLVPVRLVFVLIFFVLAAAHAETSAESPW